MSTHKDAMLEQNVHSARVVHITCTMHNIHNARVLHLMRVTHIMQIMRAMPDASTTKRTSRTKVM